MYFVLLQNADFGFAVHTKSMNLCSALVTRRKTDHIHPNRIDYENQSMQTLLRWVLRAPLSATPPMRRQENGKGGDKARDILASSSRLKYPS